MALVEDTYNLERFVRAQEHVYPRVCDELRAGAKQSHWMWFIFPQIAGLGQSAMSRRYAIASRARRRPIWTIRCWVRGCASAPALCRP